MGALAFAPQRGGYPFNTSLETGIRSLAVLDAASPGSCDLQRLSFYDYLVVHSGDVSEGPESIHPATPHRSGEFLVRRGLVERGLLLMMSRNLVARTFDDRGITYKTSPLARNFLDYLQASYTMLLRDRARWVITMFGEMTDSELTAYFRQHLGRWGSEFVSEIEQREDI
jgi:hypothetical protein